MPQALYTQALPPSSSGCPTARGGAEAKAHTSAATRVPHRLHLRGLGLLDGGHPFFDLPANVGVRLSERVPV